jgi:hypothetical protein
MRSLLFKNLTSNDKRRKILVSSEIVNKKGVRSVTHRHFVCLIKEVKDNKIIVPAPYVYVLKKHNSKDQTGRFFCKIKGNMHIAVDKRIFLIVFVHTLRINLELVPEGIKKH